MLQSVNNNISTSYEINRLPGKISAQADDSGEKPISDKVEISAPGNDTTTRVIEKPDAVDTVVDAVYIASFVGETLGATGLIGAAATLGTAGAGLYYSVKSMGDLKEAIKNKDVMGCISGAGEMLIAADSAVYLGAKVTETVAAAGHIGPSALAIFNTPLVKVLGTISSALGTGYAVTEVIGGGKDIYDGIKAKDKHDVVAGVLRVGIGAAVLGAVATGGMVASLALAGLMATDLIFRWSTYKKGVEEIGEAAVNTFKRIKRHFSPPKTETKETENIKK